MNFSKHELHILKHCIAIALLRNQQQIQRAKTIDQSCINAGRPPRAGKVAGLAMEGADYQSLWERFKKELPQ